MTTTRLTLLARVRAAKEPPYGLATWLDCRPLRELWDTTWAEVPNREYLRAIAQLARCPGLWLEDAERRADAEVARERLASKPNEKPLVATAGARGFRQVVSAEMIESCLRSERSWGEA